MGTKWQTSRGDSWSPSFPFERNLEVTLVLKTNGKKCALQALEVVRWLLVRKEEDNDQQPPRDNFQHFFREFPFVSFGACRPGPDLLVVSRPLRSNPILRETTTGSGPKTNVWKLTSRHYSVGPSSRRAGVGPTLSVNVLSFQTSLETWTTAAIINWKKSPLTRK